MTPKQEAQRKMVGAFGGGIATANDMSQIQKSEGHPTPPDKAIPSEQYAADVEAYCKTNKCQFLGQDESDPSFLVFRDEEGCKVKLKAETFVSGFRGSEQGKSY